MFDETKFWFVGLHQNISSNFVRNAKFREIPHVQIGDV